MLSKQFPQGMWRGVPGFGTKVVATVLARARDGYRVSLGDGSAPTGILCTEAYFSEGQQLIVRFIGFEGQTPVFGPATIVS
jgi:hypothetical protein